MSRSNLTVSGIDVGGERKGFHAAAFRDGHFAAKTSSADPSEIVNRCLDLDACAVVVDAHCMWSRSGSTRKAERELSMGGRIERFRLRLTSKGELPFGP